MRKKKNHSISEIPQIFNDFKVYKDLKNLQKTTNPYSINRLSTSKKKKKPNLISPTTASVNIPQKTHQKSTSNLQKSSNVYEDKSQQIADIIENQIREDVKHYSQIGEAALFGFREKVSLYNNYFTRYLFENHREISRTDLVLPPFSLFSMHENDDFSPYEKIRRQKIHGSIFGNNVQKKESFKLNSNSPTTRSKNLTMAFKDNFRIRPNQTPKNPNIIKNDTEVNCLNFETLRNDKKDKNKKSWEYLYHLGRSDLKESQQKLENLKQALNQEGSEKYENTREFFQCVKKGDLETVKFLVFEQKKKELNVEKSQKFINSIDSYVNINNIRK